MFIRDMSCISAQETYHGSFFEQEVEVFSEPLIWAKEPNYKGLIPMGLLRRMSKLVRMSVGTGLPLIEKHPDINAIIIGSSNGSVERSLRFLNQIVDYDEGTLTPTDFVQSTSNCIAGTLALMGEITGYNTTHVNQGLAFESSILDALLLLEEGKVNQVLLGGGEELSQANYNVEFQRGLYKDESLRSSELLHSDTKGTLAGEGVAMFVVEPHKNPDSIAEIVDVDMISHPSKPEVIDKVNQFLSKNSLTPQDIDAVFMGRNGDNRTDTYYDLVQSELFPDTGIFVYKPLTGEYFTASSFAMWLAAKLLSGTALPKDCIWKAGDAPVKNVLLYNHCEGSQHGFILLRNSQP